MAVLRFIVSILICQAAGVLGRFFTEMSVHTWYQELKTSALTPPASIFGPVWIGLYALMGISFFIIWQKGSGGRKVGGQLFLFFIQLILNVLWSFLFFSLKRPDLALVEIGVLIVFVLMTIFAFDRVSKTAGFLLLPYLFWLGFAAFLNYSILHLNPDLIPVKLEPLAAPSSSS